jgi:hypothetical protein
MGLLESLGQMMHGSKLNHVQLAGSCILKQRVASVNGHALPAHHIIVQMEQQCSSLVTFG